MNYKKKLISLIKNQRKKKLLKNSKKYKYKTKFKWSKMVKRSYKTYNKKKGV